MKRTENPPRFIFVREYFLQMLFLHLGLVAGAFYFLSLQTVLVGLAMGYIMGHSMGMFHHMYFTHGSFKCKLWFEMLGATLGTLSWRGAFSPPLKYVAIHRVHHDHSDTLLDPHSPIRGYFFAFMGWFWKHPEDLIKLSDYKKFTKALTSKKYLVWLDQNNQLLQFFWALLCFAAGTAYGFYMAVPNSIVEGLRFVYVGVFLKTFFVIYLGNLVDLINHTVGYQSYKTHDTSTNSFFMGLIHGGGAISWHNNHHAHQSFFAVRKNWWEYDVHYLTLKALEKLGVTWDVKVFDEFKNKIPH